MGLILTPLMLATRMNTISSVLRLGIRPFCRLKESLMDAAPGTRYSKIAEEKADGATYTPTSLADFVAGVMLREFALPSGKEPLRILDPAVGEGQLLVSLLKQLPPNRAIEVEGFDCNEDALRTARINLQGVHARADITLSRRDFLDMVCDDDCPLFGGDAIRLAPYHLVIANPPYVRTQILGAKQSQWLAARFGLGGRVDLYHAFVLGISQVLREDGVMGIIVSNRFMTTKTGAGIRAAFRQRFHLRHVWDLGDTKLFAAAVLPAVIVASGNGRNTADSPSFTSIYETTMQAKNRASTVIAALASDGVVEIDDGRRFQVRHGLLHETPGTSDVWRIQTDDGDAWLDRVKARTWGTFRNLGKIRVGIKTCADGVFILKSPFPFDDDDRPELLKPLTTHHTARRFRADTTAGLRYVIYPHECVDGKRGVVDLGRFPRTRNYLMQHRRKLEARSYVLEAGRKWYEIWVPQDPSAWARPKLVFRDISERPCFWMDLDGTIINGDCYWIVCDQPDSEDMLWLAACVGNSSFIEKFYDHCFNNKLYAGRRRFITQYVEQFPLPDPATADATELIALARRLYADAGNAETEALETELDRLVWKAFGLCPEEVGR